MIEAADLLYYTFVFVLLSILFLFLYIGLQLILLIKLAKRVLNEVNRIPLLITALRKEAQAMTFGGLAGLLSLFSKKKQSEEEI